MPKSARFRQAIDQHSHRTPDPMFSPTTLEQLEQSWKVVAAGGDA